MKNHSLGVMIASEAAHLKRMLLRHGVMAELVSTVDLNRKEVKIDGTLNFPPPDVMEQLGWFRQFGASLASIFTSATSSFRRRFGIKNVDELLQHKGMLPVRDLSESLFNYWHDDAREDAILSMNLIGQVVLRAADPELQSFVLLTNTPTGIENIEVSIALTGEEASAKVRLMMYSEIRRIVESELGQEPISDEQIESMIVYNDDTKESHWSVEGWDVVSRPADNTSNNFARA